MAWGVEVSARLSCACPELAKLVVGDRVRVPRACCEVLRCAMLARLAHNVDHGTRIGHVEIVIDRERSRLRVTLEECKVGQFVPRNLRGCFVHIYAFEIVFCILYTPY